MSESQAIELVKLHTEPESDPKLCEYELQTILVSYVEADGTYTADAVWHAIADAWDVKVNKSSDYIDVSVNGRGVSSNQVKKNCEERARWYRRRLSVNVA